MEINGKFQNLVILYRNATEYYLRVDMNSYLLKKMSLEQTQKTSQCRHVQPFLIIECRFVSYPWFPTCQDC